MHNKLIEIIRARGIYPAIRAHEIPPPLHTLDAERMGSFYAYLLFPYPPNEEAADHPEAISGSPRRSGVRLCPVFAGEPARRSDHRRRVAAAADLLCPEGHEGLQSQLRCRVGECYIAAQGFQRFAGRSLEKTRVRPMCFLKETVFLAAGYQS